MRNKFKFISFLFLGIICFSIIPLNANADNTNKTLGDLKKEYQELLNEKKQNDSQSEETKNAIAAKEKAVKDLELEVDRADRDIVIAEENIKISNETIEKLKKEAEEVLVYLQLMQGENAYIEYVTGANTMTDLITRISAIEQISDHIQTTMDDLQIEIKKNETLKKELEQKKIDCEKKKVSYIAEIKKQYSNLENYDKYALGVNEKLANAKPNLDSYIKLCSENAPSKGDKATLLECSKIPYNGGWLKPLNRGVVTSEVDMRWGKFHDALDIGGNQEGTPVYAAAAGIVEGKVNRYPCGGNMLYINVVVGGVQYTTYYYHLLKFNVNIGDIVDQNTQIGTVGGGSTSIENGGYDQCTFGAHLHFGVQKGWYTANSGIKKQNVITPPGFPNSYGWRFYSRSDWYSK